MDILKLSRLIFVFLLCVFLTSCQNNECDCEKIIGLTNGVMLSSRETKNSLKGLKIQHIRNGKIIENILYKYQYNIESKKIININRTKELYKTDSIKFLFKNMVRSILFMILYLNQNIEVNFLEAKILLVVKQIIAK